ncbi:MAG TPA: tripartite tricarboxylate transporter substrate binding protein [Alphaproteobacteria bacterium]|nr:tripartite tricarboxylate transporter substrate binding protein [Alphaproteobacteria bacterium]
MNWVSRLLAGWFGVVLLCGGALAQSAYPTKTVRIVIPFAPGGVPDIIARLLSPKMTEAMGQPFVVDNRPGAGGTLAAAHVAKSDPDGYTLFMTTVSTQAIAPGLMPNLPYDPAADFTPISHIANVPLVLVVTPSLPATNLKELIALLKANPGKYDFASSGTGAPLHLAGELFKAMSKTDIQHVPYKGSAPALTDVIAGRVAMVFDAVPPALGHIQSGRLRALGVGTKERSAMLPDVPTIDEAGLPGYEAYTWGAFFAPAKTPKPVVDRLHAEVTKALAQPDVRQRLTELGYQIVGSTPDQLDRHVKAEKEKWGKLIRDVGIKAEL